MPISRARGGTWTPSAGADTTRAPMPMRPALACSSPATQRSVVVLPQPDGPSRTTISPAATWKLTPSTAGRPMLNCLRRSRTSSAEDIALLPIIVRAVPILDPRRAQLLVLLEVRHPGLHLARVVALGQQRRHLERGQVALLLDHERLPLGRQAPVQKQLGRIR